MKSSFCRLLVLGLLCGPIACASQSRESDSTTRDTVVSQEQQKALTPAEVIEVLRDGNERYRDSAMTPTDYPAQVAASAGGQHPIAFVLGCVDSRVPPEAVFDCGLGDLFVGRVAGNFENTDLLGSMEFAVAVVGTPLVVVLGHTSCGAVKGACDDVELGNLTDLIANLRPAVDETPETGDRSSANKEFVDRVVETNVRRTVRDVLERSPTIAALVESGDAAVVGAIYDLKTGEVAWLDTE